MRERLMQIMQEKGFTASKMAELLGVGPSAISHILSGRNNPSYDIIVKLLDSFPDIDPRFLLTGKISAGEYSPGANNYNLSTPQSDHGLFAEGSSGNAETVTILHNSSHPDADYPNTDSKGPQSNLFASEPSVPPSSSASQAINQSRNQYHTVASEAIPEHMYIIYSDGTFRSYKYQK